MVPYDEEDLAFAWEILKDLSDRAGIPEWLGEVDNDDAKFVARDLATLINVKKTR